MEGTGQLCIACSEFCHRVRRNAHYQETHIIGVRIATMDVNNQHGAIKVYKGPQWVC